MNRTTNPFQIVVCGVFNLQNEVFLIRHFEKDEEEKRKGRSDYYWQLPTISVSEERSLESETVSWLTREMGMKPKAAERARPHFSRLASKLVHCVGVVHLEYDTKVALDGCRWQPLSEVNLEDLEPLSRKFIHELT